MKHVVLATAGQQRYTCVHFSHDTAESKDVDLAIVLARCQDDLWRSIPPCAYVASMLATVLVNFFSEAKVCYFERPILVQQIFRLQISMEYFLLMTILNTLQTLPDYKPYSVFPDHRFSFVPLLLSDQVEHSALLQLKH